jgi:hypothetical protein
LEGAQETGVSFPAGSSNADVDPAQVVIRKCVHELQARILEQGEEFVQGPLESLLELVCGDVVERRNGNAVRPVDFGSRAGFGVRTTHGLIFARLRQICGEAPENYATGDTIDGVAAASTNEGAVPVRFR